MGENTAVSEGPATEVDFSRVIDALPGLVWTARADGHIDFVNQRWCDYTGLTLGSAYGWGWQTAICAEDLPGVLERWRSMLASGLAGEFEARLKRFDGQYRRFLIGTSALRDATGQIVKWCGVSTDVEDLRQAEEALRARERFRVIVDDLPAMITLMTPDGEFAEGNRHMLEYFGASLEELKRRPTTDSFHPDDRPAVDARWKESVETGRPYDFEARLRGADGTYRWFHTRGFPIRDAQGRIVLWHLLQTDVDDRNRAEEALRERERESRLIVDSIPGLVALLAPSGDIEVVNRQVHEYFGQTLDELRQWATNGTIHPDDLPNVIEVFSRSLSSGTPYEIVQRFRRADGVYRWFGNRGFPVRDPNGQVVRWCVLLTDIDDLKRAEDGIQRAYDHLAEAQRLSLTGSFTSDLAKDEHYWSEEFYRICEFEPGSTVTVQRLGEIVHPEDVVLYEGAIQRAIAGTEPEFHFRIVTARGAVKHLRGFAHRIADRPVFVGAVQDVTASRVAEDALNKARAELAHVARLATLSTLTASIAHEINQPLSGIITNAGTCLRMLDASPPNIEGARETARRTIRDGNRASEVVTRLRALFSKKEFTLEPLDLNEATREVIALSSSDLQRHRVIMQSELSDDLPAITGDRVQLQQVILNLVRNASDAMAGVDNRPRQLLIRTEREDGDRVRLTVRDAGTGLDRESMDKLFDAFYTTKSQGMGIGLSVSRSIVERHHGRLWAEPNAGPGATFAFSIPAVQPAVKKAAPS